MVQSKQRATSRQVAAAQNARERLLFLEGAGTRPCITAAHTWLGCVQCSQRCILEPYHALSTAERKALAAQVAALRAKEAKRA
jgi:hypothetical protein